MTLTSGFENVTESGSVIYKKNADGGRVQKVRANGADIFLTAIVTAYGETEPDVDLCGTGEPVSGVIIGSYDPYEVDLTKDSDSCFADNKELQMYIPNRGDQLYGTVKTNTSITLREWVDVDGGFLISGTRTAHIGIALEPVTGASATEDIILYQWDQGL